MEKSLLYATHQAMYDVLLFPHNIWSIYACTPGNRMHIPMKWKVKTEKYLKSYSKYTYDSLKYVDDKDGKSRVIVFDFGFIKQEKLLGIGKFGVWLQHNYELERKVVEKICKLSDDGHVIVSNGEVLLDKFKGSEFLINIDLAAPSYSYMDEPIDVPF